MGYKEGVVQYNEQQCFVSASCANNLLKKTDNDKRGFMKRLFLQVK